jgi:hypothetical protein
MLPAGGNSFFFEKKKRDSFAPAHLDRRAHPAGHAAAGDKKFFGSFFQERTTSLLSLDMRGNR